ncbi:MAG TPA: serine hydrolase domain-containing protein [Gemmatimonadales bacterium]|nr:serine hydrolase domain-containing protein [Gemmatimonadales bacterium]
MFARSTIALFTLAAAAGACTTDETGPGHPTPASAIDSVLLEARAGTGLPGMAAIVVRADTIEAIGAIGVRRRGHPEAVTTADRFHIGSNVKAMTATMIATLVEEGALAWDTRPADVFPELAATMDPAYQGITLAQLLSHRAGIEPLLDFSQVPAIPGTPSEQRYAGTALLLSLPPAGPVGEFLYSNGGYGVAAAMAERVTGQSWEQLLTTRLLAPLGITPVFGWPAAGHAAQPWGHLPGSFTPVNPDAAPDMPDAIDPAGEMALSLTEYARFVQLHLRGLTGRPDLLSGAGFAALHHPTGDYALGWGEIVLGGEPTATHDGSTGTFYATVLMQPGRDLAVIVVANAGGEVAAGAVVQAAVTLLGRYGGVVPAAGVAALPAARYR